MSKADLEAERTPDPSPAAAYEAALHFAPEAYRTGGAKLMGRQAAGEAFMRAWLTHSRQRTFRARVETRAHGEAFREAVHTLRPDAATAVVTAAELSRLGEGGLLFYPGPDIVHSAWQRSLFGSTRWSLCGITHTTASAAAMDAISGWLTAPLHPWDAVICTSRGVADTVKVVLEEQARHLVARLGATRLTLPMLPVIPLGVHIEDFEFTGEERAQARRDLGVPEHCCVVLYLGRLSFHAKAHPLAMYQALQAAAERQKLPGSDRLLLIECGWHANPHIEQAFAEAANGTMPDVTRLGLDGRDAAVRRKAWAAADVFCSLSDNVQETFGLTPVEAMAAGLPVVVTDWNGYRDTVRHGVDGLRVPTCMPPAGDGADLAADHALGLINYDHYCGHASAAVAVDVRACTEAFAGLCANAELRATMGRAGRARARETFAWSVIYRQYEALWDEMDRRRRTATATHPLPRHPWPARMDPFTAFSSYPSATFGDETEICLATASLPDALAQLETRRLLAMVRPFVGAEAALLLSQRILEQAAKPGGLCLGELAVILDARPEQVRRRVAWLCKLDLLRVKPPNRP